jgi:hypothetical protein
MALKQCVTSPALLLISQNMGRSWTRKGSYKMKYANCRTLPSYVTHLCAYFPGEGANRESYAS